MPVSHMQLQINLLHNVRESGYGDGKRQQHNRNGNKHRLYRSTTTFSSTTSGGTWSSATPAVATVNASTGVARVSAGIKYYQL
jgi:hypothetical protein